MFTHFFSLYQSIVNRINVMNASVIAGNCGFLRRLPERMKVPGGQTKIQFYTVFIGKLISKKMR
jgi:hypothetical protein